MLGQRRYHLGHQFLGEPRRDRLYQRISDLAKVIDKGIDGDDETFWDIKTGAQHGAQVRGFAAHKLGVLKSQFT